MTPERWSRVREIFAAAIERDAGSRAAFLELECGSDPELRGEVERLLRAQTPTSNFFRPPLEKLSLTGQTISHYEVLEQLGAGGMGIVYKARDTVLKRHVALKVLPPAQRADPERRRRFVREAQAASALNHPNIAAVYEVFEHESVLFISMEYVEGETLDQLVPKRGMRLAEALPIAVQIAEALAAAHEAGVIHRDLKPGNVMVSNKKLVKVLDFGLAKLMEPESREVAVTVSLAQEPAPRTLDGTILGTAAYMSPEQAEGKNLDARSDIFSFGSVVYEMATGRRAFRGDTSMSTMAAVLHEEPEGLPELPQELGRIVRRCLRKDPERRFQHIGDVKVELAELNEESAPAAAATRTKRKHGRGVLIAGAAVIAAVAVAFAFWGSREHPPEQALHPVPLTTYEGTETSPAFSPDGNQVAFSWNGPKQDNVDLYVKVVGAGEPVRLTTDPARDSSPAWSPDGRFIAFVRWQPPNPSGDVMLVPALGGAERKVGTTSVHPVGDFGPCLSWSADGKWLAVPDYSSAGEPISLFLLSAETGEKRKLIAAEGRGDYYPAFSPDGRSLLFTREGNVHTLALTGDLAPNGKPRQLTFFDSGIEIIRPAWTADGSEIILARGLTLWRVSASGSGRPRPLAIPAAAGTWPAISRLGRRLAYSRRRADSNIWRVETTNEGAARESRTKLIASTQTDAAMDYSSNGERIAFSSTRSGNQEIWTANSDGSSPMQMTFFNGAYVGSPRWSPNGEWIAFDAWMEGGDIFIVSANGGKPRRFTEHAAYDAVPTWSRDGKWIYFRSSRGGSQQIWKKPVEGGTAIQVTKNGGSQAFESPDGKSVYFVKGGVHGLWKMTREGGEEEFVLEGVRFLRFCIDSRGVYFYQLDDPNRPETGAIRAYSFATKQVRTIEKLNKPVGTGMTVSPDGRWLLYASEDQTGSDLMLVEGFE